MEAHHLSLEETGRFAPIVLDHVAMRPPAAGLSAFAPDLDGILSAIHTRTFDQGTRKVLVEVLRDQYKGVPVHAAVEEGLKALALNDTYTITTGHQLCLFGGPLYVPLKILNVVGLARRATAELKGRGRVVPIFWMASEDHDRDEIDHVHVNGSRVAWPGKAAGAVGRMPLRGIAEVVKRLGVLLGPGVNADRVREVIDHCYRPERTLAEATRFFIDAFFGRFGVICLDADDQRLKRLFLPVMRRELAEGATERAVRPVNDTIAAHYKVQAHARDVNLFLLGQDSRERIVRKDGAAGTGTGGMMPLEAMLDRMEQAPEIFSPNVLLRPLYQERVLPNICYVGGGGELAYWLQLKQLFKAFDLPMPVLLLRSSAAFLPYKEFARTRDLGLSIPDLFQPIETLRRRVAREKAGLRTDMAGEREALDRIFQELKERAKQVDPTLERSAGSAQALANKGLDHLEKRFMRVAKARARQELARLSMVTDVLFPGGTLQERRENVLPLLARHGEALFDELLEKLDPLEPGLTVLVEGPLADQ